MPREDAWGKMLFSALLQNLKAQPIPTKSLFQAWAMLLYLKHAFPPPLPSQDTQQGWRVARCPAWSLQRDQHSWCAPFLGSLKGPKGTRETTTAPHLVCSALSTIWELAQGYVKGNAAGCVLIAKTPGVLPEKSDLGMPMKLVAYHLINYPPGCSSFTATQMYCRAALS